MIFNPNLDKLQSIYDRKGNDIVVLYGPDSNMLFSLLKDFFNNKDYFFYKASCVEKTLQHSLFIKAINNHIKNSTYISGSYRDIFESYLENSSAPKKVIIFDDFVNLIRNDSTFINFLISLNSDEHIKNNVLFILATSECTYVENTLPELLGKNIYELSAIINTGYLSLEDCRMNFSFISPCDRLILYSCLGGNLSFWNLFDNSTDVRSFLINNLVNSYGLIHLKGHEILPKDLRQISLYQTILYYLANGYEKLNDLHKITGIERAKLSVYIKTLIEYKLVKKCVNTIEIGDSSNTLKGVYKIADPFVHFWYTFIFPNHSLLSEYTPERFFRKIIEPNLGTYLEEYYPQYCMIRLMSDKDYSLPDLEITKIDYYNDKNKIIDVILTTDKGETIICACNISSPHMSYKDYELVLEIIQNNHIKYDRIALFSAGGFDQKLTLSNLVDDTMLLFDGKDNWMKSINITS